jgi:hypothetical protein
MTFENPLRSLPVIILMLAAAAGPADGQTTQPVEPVEISKLPFIEIFSPTFFWNDTADFVRLGSTTCPKGRAVTGGVSIRQGKASLRILESFPDGESWVMRVVNRARPGKVESLQVRGFALCMLPVARKASKQIAQYTRLQHVSGPFALPTGYVSTSARQACPQGGLVIGGGFGIDPKYRGPAVPRLELSYPDPDGWNVRAVNGANPAGPAADARAYAVCLGNEGGVDIKGFNSVFFASKDVSVKYGGDAVREAVSCGRERSYVVAGGSRTLRGRAAMVETEESFPDTPSSWTTGVTNRGSRSDGNATVRLYAVCIGP